MSAYEQICQVLHAAVSPTSELRLPADAQLKQWEVEPGFHSTLQDVAADVSLDVKLRLLAAITLKNGIDKYWRKTVRVGAVQAAEKDKIRQKSLTMFAEENDKIATYNSVTISKIARLDFPNDWPNLLHSLIQIIQTSFEDTPDSNVRRRIQYRSLNTLYMVVKVLCSKMLPASKKMFQQIAPELLRYTVTIFTDRCSHFLQIIGSPGASAADYASAENAIRLAAVSLKALRRVAVYGYRDFHQSEEVVGTANMLVEYLQKLLSLRTSTSSCSPITRRSYNSIISQIGKVYLNLQAQDVASFVKIPSSIDIVRFYWSKVEESAVPQDDIVQEKLLIQALKMLKTLVKNPSLNGPLHGSEHTSGHHVLDATPTSAYTQAETPSVKRAVSQNLLTPEFVTRACEVLVGRYMVLGVEERQTWEENPEEWFVELEADRWEFSLRACAEKVFMDLMSTNRAVLQPVVMNMLQVASAPVTDPSDFDRILLKDAVYGAVGLAAHDLFDFVNFEQWFQNSLANEAATADSRFTILHRRIGWLVAQWLPVQPSPSLYAPVYALLLNLMASDRDMAVRLTAVSSLRTVVDDFGFDINVFAPYIESVLSNLASLLTEVDGVDCLGGVVGCLSGVVERLQGAIVPHVPSLLHILPRLWELAEGQEMFRASILHIFSKLVVSLRADSRQLHPIILSILAYSVDINNPAHVYLLEDGLDLWYAVLCNATELTEELYSLVPLAVQVLGFGTEGLKKALGIVECYVVLDVRVLETHAPGILSQISDTLGTLRPEAARATLHCLDLIVQTAYPSHLAPLQQALFETGIVDKLLATILNDTELAVVVVPCLTLIARLATCDPACMAALLSANGGVALDVWLDKFDNMGQSKQRKMTAVGLTALCGLLTEIPTSSPLTPSHPSPGQQHHQQLLVPRIPSILPVVSSVLADSASRKLLSKYGHFRHLGDSQPNNVDEEVEDDEDPLEDDSGDLGTFDQTIDPDPENAAHTHRKQALRDRDPCVYPPHGNRTGKAGAAFKAYVGTVWTSVVRSLGVAAVDMVAGADELKELIGLSVATA
ncbi:hypothetical protein PhCBS80983_g04187 [Powellomyces hirtus]|uniref:Importin N-terminal domain-containing protein n=1 Tax=Powellomyces hirtus TaxID=109895 RepID=A0A507E157_9FUNG|nr:hypothetical protein PhCBS80983_g04187 [Powellomyces hirtus]